MFRHLVITGRSRLALYLVRIPAGLAITIPLVALLGDDLGDRRLDRRLIGNRNMADDNPRRLTQLSDDHRWR
jgi:hypothetical protein